MKCWNRNYMLILLTLAGCASAEKGAMLGAAAGGGTGLLINSNQSGLTAEQRATGLVIGAAIGGLIGYLASKEKNRKAEKATPLSPTTVPKIKSPEVRKIWVPDEINGDEYVQGHWKFLINEPAVWTKEVEQ